MKNSVLTIKVMIFAIAMCFWGVSSVFGQTSIPHDQSKVNADWKHYNIPVENLEAFESGKSMIATWIAAPEFKLSQNPVIRSSSGYNFFIKKIERSCGHDINFKFTASIAEKEYTGQGDVIVSVYLVDKNWIHFKENTIDFKGIEGYLLTRNKILESDKMGDVEKGTLSIEKLEKDSFIIIVIGSYDPVKINMSVSSFVYEDGQITTKGNTWFD